MTPRLHTFKTKRIRRPGVDGWVSIEQLMRDIDRGHKHWLENQSSGAVVVVTRRRGRPRSPEVTAAIREWRDLGCPKQGFAEICRRHGANYGAAVVRRSKEEKRRRLAA